MSIRRYFLFLCCLFLSVENISAQSEYSLSAIVQQLDTVYGDLDGNNIPTGYLKDRTVDLVHLSVHNGQALCDSNYVRPELFRDLLRTMNGARVNTTVTLYNADNAYTALTTSSSNRIKLTAAVFHYNVIVANAIENNKITYNSVTGKVSDKYINGIWQNPYTSDYACMFTVGQLYSAGYTVTYDLSSLLNFGNCAFSTVEIDFGNGTYSQINNLSDRTITYSSGGIKELKLRITLTNNIVLLSHTSIVVGDDIVQTKTPTDPSNRPDDSLLVSSNGVSAKCYIKYHPDHNGCIKKPFIYVEGFDHPIMAELSHPQWNSFDKIVNNECAGNYNFSNEYPNLDLELNSNGYDFFYVDWNNPEADIKLNAVLLDSIIVRINRLKVTDGTAERNVLVAHSMGGLISRWALTQMEQNGINHQVDYFVSQDVPHKGAVVPVGAIYALRDVYRCLFGPSGNNGLSNLPRVKLFFDRIIGVLESTSARQMMYNYVNSNGTIDNSVHQEWQEDLDDAGFPAGDYGFPIHNLAIASGGDLGNSELSNEILSLTFGLTGWLNYLNLLSVSNLRLVIDVDRDRSPGVRVSKTALTYTHISNFLPPVFFYLQNREHYSTTGTGQYDVAYGSYLPFSDPVPTWADILLLPIGHFSACNKMIFVPMGSSLATNIYSCDYYNQPSLLLNNCPFDSFCIDQNAQRHDSNLVDYIAWVVKHIRIALNCCSVIKSGDFVSISNTPSGISTETIGSMNNSVFTINSGGQVCVIDTLGFGRIKYHASGNEFCGSDGYQLRDYSIEKLVLTGFPDMVLSATITSAIHYRIDATCISSQQQLQSVLDEICAGGGIKFIWGYKNADNSYNWTDTTSTRSFTCSAPPGAITHVAMKMYCSSTRQSTPCVITIDRSFTEPFFRDPHETVVTDVSQVTNYTYITNSQIISNCYFAVWKNSDYNSTVDDPDNLLINGVTVPLETTYYLSVNGENKTVYCFDFMNSAPVQNAYTNAVNSYNSNFPHIQFVTIQIRNGTTSLQTVLHSFIPENINVLNPGI